MDAETKEYIDRQDGLLWRFLSDMITALQDGKQPPKYPPAYLHPEQTAL